MTSRDRMDRRLAAELEVIMAARIEHDVARRDISAPGGSSRVGRRTIWVTAVVGVVVVLLAVTAIRVGGGRSEHGLPAASRLDGDAQANATLLERLPKQAHGTTVHTWTDRDPAGSGPFRVTGSTVVIAGICEGGGAISIRDAGGKAHTLSCRHRSVQQPFWRFDLGGDGKDTVETGLVHVSVRAVTGAPRFVVRMWKVDPRVLRSTWVIADTSGTVPASLRTCRAGDLAPTGTLDRLDHEQGGVVTITNRSSTDCAVRSWPAMVFLDASGRRIGPVQGGDSDNGRSLDSREGAVNEYKEFPPARLTAGGRGYLIAEFFPRTRLEHDDAVTRAAAARAAASPAPTPSMPTLPIQLCHPVTVAKIRLTISDSSVTVPAPAGPATAGCRSSGFSFGVDPVVVRNPAVR